MPLQLVLLTALLGCGSSSEGNVGSGTNVLLILLDDVGPEAVAGWALHPSPPHTPTLDRLAAEGMSFSRAYASPVCSPGRAQFLTGRYGRRNGVIHNLRYRDDEVSLPLAEVTVAEVAQQSAHGPYATAAFGKWHLMTESHPDALLHPNDQGFDHFDGTAGNLNLVTGDNHEQRHGYFHWERLVDGVVEHVDDYNPSFTIDRALEHLHTMPEPWLIYVPLHSAHGPNHVPPADLHGVDATEDDPDHVTFAAMVEAADTEIGRLLDGIPPEVLQRTMVVVAADNGAWADNMPPPWDVLGGKTTMAEGGLRVPLIVVAPQVVAPGSTSDVPVHVVDILPTVADVVGADPEAIDGPDGPGLVLDGVSLVPLLRGEAIGRDVVYAELAGPPGPPPYTWKNQRAAMSRTHKVLWNEGEASWAWHGVGPSPADESEDVFGVEPSVAEVEAYEALQDEVDRMIDALPDGG